MPNAKKKTSFKNDSGRVNKSAWIRSQPKSLSVSALLQRCVVQLAQTLERLSHRRVLRFARVQPIAVNPDHACSMVGSWLTDKHYVVQTTLLSDSCITWF